MFDEIAITFADQNGRPLVTEDKVNLKFLINIYDTLLYRTKNEGKSQKYGFLSLARNLSHKYVKKYWILLLELEYNCKYSKNCFES